MYDDNVDYRRPKSHNVTFVASENCIACKALTRQEQEKKPLVSRENVKVVFIGCKSHPTG